VKRVQKFALALLISAGFTSQSIAVDPPYQQDMERLGHIMGALYHLDAICIKSEQDWRNDFAELMDLDEVDEDRRARLSAAFNTGYEDYARLHFRCTPNARAQLQLFIAEGAEITRNIHTRFAE
jgi:uncharacterized protein (TIGR02301 family)